MIPNTFSLIKEHHSKTFENRVSLGANLMIIRAREQACTICNMIICGQILVNIFFILHRSVLTLFHYWATMFKFLSGHIQGGRKPHKYSKKINFSGILSAMSMYFRT